MFVILSLLLEFHPHRSLKATHIKCGPNLTCSFDEITKNFTVTGSGEMDNYTSSHTVPWYSNRTKVLHITIENEVTSIGDYAFSNFIISLLLVK